MIKFKNNNFLKKKYCFDIDGVICQTNLSDYKKSKPIRKAIKKINSLYLEGHQIIIFTSRFMGRNKENINLAERQGYIFTFKQLKRWKLKFHKLILGKPSYDFIVDDRAINFKNWINNI